MNKIKCLNTPVLVQSNWTNNSKQEVSYVPSQFGLCPKKELKFSKKFSGFYWSRNHFDLCEN